MDRILLAVGVALVVVLALVAKLSFLAGLAAAVSRRMDSDDTAVAGRWRLRDGEGGALSHPPTHGTTKAGGTVQVASHGAASGSREATARVAGALRGFVERDVSWLKIERTHAAVRVISAEGTVVNYATDGFKIERRLGAGITVQAKADWCGDELHLELSTSGDARVEETYTPLEDRGCLEVEVQLIVPEAGLDMQLTRTYDRTENAGPI